MPLLEMDEALPAEGVEMAKIPVSTAAAVGSGGSAKVKVAEQDRWDTLPPAVSAEAVDLLSLDEEAGKPGGAER